MDIGNVTITPEEAAEIIRSRGIKIGAEAVRDGIEQGVLPFGIMILQGKRNYFISRKKLNEWLIDFCGA